MRAKHTLSGYQLTSEPGLTVVDSAIKEPDVLAIGVRELAEFVHRRGDIHLRYDRSTTGAEGVAAQRKAQQNRSASYQREFSVRHEFDVHYGLPDEPAKTQHCLLRGRIDGCDLAAGLVEEFKTTRANIDLAHAHAGALHMAQLKLYGGLLTLAHPELTELRLTLCYCHPEDGLVKTDSIECSPAELQQYLEQTLAVYEQRLSQHFSYQLLRNQRIDGASFPFSTGFRPNQRALAGRSYQALCEGTNLLLEAGTGTGKTLGVLFPAFKALANSSLDSLFFLSSRSTGQDAAQNAAALLAKTEARVITIIAREKACLVEGMPCTPQACEYARGYYDRVSPAVEQLLALGQSSPAQVESLAIEHKVCPFELSLDASVWCDLVVMDYNYLFDPQVKLQRFAQRPNTGVLIDEAHQLSERVREMLSAQINRWQIDAAIASATPTAVALRSSLVSLRRSFVRVINQVDTVDAAVEFPQALANRLQSFCDELVAQGAPGDPIGAGDEALLALYFAALRFGRAQEWSSDDNRASFVRVASKTLQLTCLDPAEHIQSTLARYGPNIRFSGTLTPLALYRKMHGHPETTLLRAATASDNDQLGVYVVPNIPTYLRRRSASLPALVTLVREIFDARPGNYFVAFPSYAYLDAFTELFRQTHPEVPLVAQVSQSTSAEQERFIEQFRSSQEPLLGAVVLGGMYTESLDFTGEALVGMVIVGVALPPPDVTRDAIAQHFDGAADVAEPTGGSVGEDIAYRQPAMIRVVQAAGRVVRGPSDRGIVCLVDERFLRPEFSRFTPVHWNHRVVRAQDIAAALQSFWLGNADAHAPATLLE